MTAGQPDFNRNVHSLLGLPFDAVDMSGAVQLIRDAIRKRTPCFLSTPNLNFLVGCRRDGKFRESVINSDLSIADGMPLVWIARLLGIPIRERVAGSSLFQELRNDVDQPLSVYFFGGEDGVAERACVRLNEGASAMKCAGFICPGFGSVEDMSSDEIINRINASGADFLVVALGAKKGQAWIVRNRDRISVPVISHLGAVINFIAGTVNRAPVWVQRLGLEWLWRIKEEPALWHRYFSDGWALISLLITRVLPHILYLHCHKIDEAQLETASVNIRPVGEDCVVELRGAWTERNIDPLRNCFSEAARSPGNVRLEARGITYADSALVGLVMLLHGCLEGQGRLLLIDCSSKPLRRLLKYSCAEYMFVES